MRSYVGDCWWAAVLSSQRGWLLKNHTLRRTKSDCCIWNEVVFAVIVFSDPWDFRETLRRCAPDWWVYFTPGYMVQATDWSAASVPTLLSEEVTSIHPIKLLAQARQLWKIGAIPAFLSKMGPLLNWEGWTCFLRCKCQGKKFLSCNLNNVYGDGRKNSVDYCWSSLGKWISMWWWKKTEEAVIKITHFL